MAEKIIKTKNAGQTANLFGNFDFNIAQVEKAFGVNISNRPDDTGTGDCVIISCDNGENLSMAYAVMEYLYDVVDRGTDHGIYH